MDHRFGEEDHVAKKKPTLKRYNEWDIVYKSKYSLYKLYTIKNYKNLSLESEYEIGTHYKMN